LNIDLRRGLVACANANAPHTNMSQFFITLDRTDGLNKRNTIFGKVTGDTIYNLANMNELEVEENDRQVSVLADLRSPAQSCNLAAQLRRYRCCCRWPPRCFAHANTLLRWRSIAGYLAETLLSGDVGIMRCR